MRPRGDSRDPRSRRPKGALGSTSRLFGLLPALKRGTTVWHLDKGEAGVFLRETQTLKKTADGQVLVNGMPKGERRRGNPNSIPSDTSADCPMKRTKPDRWAPWSSSAHSKRGKVVLWGNKKLVHEDGSTTTVYFQKPTAGSRILQPGMHPASRASTVTRRSTRSISCH
ncbi:MAG: hypothetical protein Ct9H300mP1_15740 [Planctomycetaceae bacterium]|nr:MAG: hypothetical protein Ct9H300mP1_15740 [Planctomycetaceae bacterium]